MIKSDSHFIKGFSHDVCEDYAISCENFASISDGCSSENNTDVGARLLCYYAKLYYEKQYHINSNVYGFIESVNEFAKMLSIDNKCLCSTLLSIYLDFDDCCDGYNVKMLKFSVFGDGVIVYKYRDLDLVYADFEFSHNAPSYLYYLLNRISHEEYQKFSKDNKLIINYNGYKLESMIDCSRDYCYHTRTVINGLEYAVVISDGIKSFVDSKNNKCEYDMRTLLNKLLDFKNANGRFVVRRLRKFIKDMEKDGFRNYDDISLGVLYFE